MLKCTSLIPSRTLSRSHLLFPSSFQLLQPGQCNFLLPLLVLNPSVPLLDILLQRLNLPLPSALWRFTKAIGVAGCRRLGVSVVVGGIPDRRKFKGAMVARGDSGNR